MTAPIVVATRPELATARDAMPGRVAVVMTMGALHEGHLRLIDVAHEVADSVLVTIFVNPLQFGPGEDLDRYPRTLEADLAACASRSVDVVFTPSEAVIYPPGEPVAHRSAGELGNRWEGAIRPGHFDGVLTVVGTLLDLVRPDVALFGEKDAQQLALIRRMVVAEGRPIEILSVPTIREPDGLALSSRNRYLSADERADAAALSRALAAGADAADSGSAAMVDAAVRVLRTVPSVAVDYVAVVDDQTWEEPGTQTRVARILVSGRVGSTHLIDNVQVDLPDHTLLDHTRHTLGTHVPPAG